MASDLETGPWTGLSSASWLESLCEWIEWVASPERSMYRDVRIERRAMRITHCEDQCLVALTTAEASRLVDACALLVLAAESVPQASLPPEMATLLGQLFDGLRATTEAPPGSRS